MNIIEDVLSFCKKNIAKNNECIIYPDTKLIETFTIDSLDAIEILVMLEKEFSIVIDDDFLNLNLLETPKKICTYVESKLNIDQ